MGSIPTPGTVNPITSFSPTTVLWVALGGAVGSALRFAAGDLMRRVTALGAFPWATMCINVAGSFVIGWFLHWASTAQVTPQLRAFVAIGICGGFTTFSTFAVENLMLLQNGEVGRAALHAGLSFTLTVGAAYVGYVLASS